MVVSLLCGKELYLRRNKADSENFITRNNEWKGRLKGDSFSISRDDGWILNFNKGRLSNVTTDSGEVLEWDYSSKDITISKGGSRIFLAVRSSSDGQISQLQYNNQSFDFSYRKCPLVQVVGGVPLISRLDSALGEVSGLAAKISCEYGVDERLTVSSIKISNPQGLSEYSWKCDSGYAISDGNWNYLVEKKNGDAKPHITRTNDKGDSESYFHSARDGRIDRKLLDSSVTKTYYFSTPGPLFNKIRKIESEKDGETKKLYSAAYFENGKILREIDKDGVETTFDENGRLMLKKQGKNVLLEQVFESGKLLARKDALKGIDLLYFYNNDGSVSITTLLNKVPITKKTMNLQGKITSITSL